VAANDTRRLRVVVTGDSTGAQQSLEQVGQSAEKSESKLGSLAKTVAGFAGKGVLALGAVGAAAATMGISTATNLETVTVGFTTMLGSATKAQKFLKQLQQFANTTPFEFDDVTGAAQKFLSMGFAAKDVIPMLTAVGDAVAAMGGGAEQIDSVTTALSQMQVKGHVAGDEIMQLSEQGVPALQILADGFGVSTSQMQKMISNGSVLSGKAIPMIVRGLEDGTKNVKGFGGMMSAQSETMAGKWSTFMDTMKTGLGNLAYKFLPIAKKAIDVASVSFQAFFSGLSGATGGASKGIAGVFGAIGGDISAMIAAFKTGTIVSKGFRGELENITSTISNMITIFKGMPIAAEAENPFTKTAHIIMNDLIPALEKIVSTTITVIGWFKQHEAVAITLASAIGALVAVTKTYDAVLAFQKAGGLPGIIRNFSLIQKIIKVNTAVQWAYNGAIAAGEYLQIAGYLGAVAVAQKVVAAATKVATAVQWLWNAALDANPIGIVVVAIGALVAAVVYLWKNNEGFRNWVVNVLWASLKKAWQDIENVVMAVVHGLINGWNSFKNALMGVWNAIWGFLAPIINKIVSIMSPIISAIIKIETTLAAFYYNVWKAIWILIQIAAKIAIAYFTQIIVPAFQWIFNKIASFFLWFYHSIVQPVWNGIKALVDGVANWFNANVVPRFNAAMNKIASILTWIHNKFEVAWNTIKGKVTEAINVISGPLSKAWSIAAGKFNSIMSNLRNQWNTHWDALKSKVSNVTGAIVTGFNKMKDGIQAAWSKVTSLTKAPVNFVINDVYNNRIRGFFNKLASAFGIKTRLDPIKGFAKGGVVGNGVGTRDDTLAVLTRGEGILTTREMKALGGKQGFAELRNSLTGYNKGGVVGDIGGWASSLASKASGFIQGMAGSAIKPLVNTLRSFINGHLSTDGIAGYMRAGSNNVLDKLVSWVSGKDKAAGSLTYYGKGGLGNGSVMGWQNMLRAINGAGFNFHPSVGQTYGGGHAPGSYHYQGRALDLSPPSMKAFNWILSTYGKNIKELIYGPAGGRNIKDGRPHNYSPGLLAQHYNHVHWAMDSASTVQPGWFTGYNGTGKPETLVNADKIGNGVTINGGLHLHGVQDVKSLRDELLKLSKRNGGSAGLPKS
jgi:tape measure domain-containing protein